MPTTIRIADLQGRTDLPPELPSVSIFLIIAMIELAVVAFAGGQWASFGEQSLWW